jgi:mgtE-like transporter
MAQGFLRGFLQGLLSLSTCVIDLVAGLLLAASAGILEAVPWAILAVPPLLSFRGAIIGVFVGRLSTGLHLGIMYPSIRGNTSHFYSLVLSVYLLRLSGSLLVSTLIWVLASLGGFEVPYLDLLLLLVATLEASALLTLVVMLVVSRAAYRLGLDPDYVLYPTTSTIADILSIGVFVLMVSHAFILGWVHVLFLVAASCYLAPLALLFRAGFSAGEVLRVFRESLISLLVVALVISATSLVLGEVSRVVGGLPLIYLLYPSLLTCTGDLGSIVGSVLTTKLHLGEVEAEFSRGFRGFLALLAPPSAAYLVVVFLLASTYPLILGYGFGGALLGVVPPILFSGILSLSLVACLVFLVALATFRAGLDPDHFLNPIVTSSADLVMTLALYLSVSLLGFSG